ncbi:MAG: ornithine carbamoyltransferase [Alphaproteobacteria bacterium]|nr:ornithine carbamoyltransferase [Alphaproteobacteria bacterium]
MSAPKHFLDLDAFDAATLRHILDLGAAYKRGEAEVKAPWAGKTLVMIFEKPSTRTRVSFEVGVQQLGGFAIVLGIAESQLGRGETIADTARVLSRYGDAIMIRTTAADRLDELSAHATVPVINGLTDNSHPCQIMADVMTFEEHRGPIGGATVAWLGDGNNVAASWIHAAVKFGFELRLACPEELEPRAELLSWAAQNGGKVFVTRDAKGAVDGADAVVTDTWVSMGQEDAGTRHNLLAPYRVDTALMSGAKADAIFMHCLPAHRGDEMTDEIIDGPHSVVWDEAENRLHAQKGIMAWCLEGAD